MSNDPAEGAALESQVFELLEIRGGHFRLESGYHSNQWCELEALFARPERLRPLVSALAERLARHAIDAVAGPMSGGAKLAHLISRELGIRCLVTERFEPDAPGGLFAVRYRLPAAQRGAVAGARVAIVDDAISAGSAVCGSYHDLLDCGAYPVALGALVVFGDAIVPFATRHGLALERIAQMPFDLWAPAECPLCKAGVPLATITA